MSIVGFKTENGNFTRHVYIHKETHSGVLELICLCHKHVLNVKYLNRTFDVTVIVYFCVSTNTP